MPYIWWTKYSKMPLLSFHYILIVVIFHLNFIAINSMTYIYLIKTFFVDRHLEWYSPLKVLTTIWVQANIPFHSNMKY